MLKISFYFLSLIIAIIIKYIGHCLSVLTATVPHVNSKYLCCCYQDHKRICTFVSLFFQLLAKLSSEHVFLLCFYFFDIQGQKFVGDLLPDGKIKSQETDIVFASPSAWAINCKRIINPVKKSGCGWASVKYHGKKLDAYKNIWFKRKKEEEELLERVDEPSESKSQFFFVSKFLKVFCQVFLVCQFYSEALHVFCHK